MRCLYRCDDHALYARSVNRRDFVRVSDGRLWVYESHKWLLDATSGNAVAHRTGGVYYGADTGLPLYYEAPEHPVDVTPGEIASEGSL